jgi:hypothetical protein
MLSALYDHPMGSAESPLRFADDLILSELQDVAFFIQTRQFLLSLHEMGQVKATPKGNLTRKSVAELADIFLDPEKKEIIHSVSKVLNEEDVFQLHIARVVSKFAGLIGLRKGQYSVRKKALPLLKEEAAGKLYRQLFLAYFNKFNLGYRHRYAPEIDWLQFEIRYVLKPLQDQGEHWIELDQLGQRLLHPMAFANLQSDLSDSPFITPNTLIRIYFIDPLEEWGLVEVERDKDDPYYHTIKRIRKSPLLDRFISFETTSHN